MDVRLSLSVSSTSDVLVSLVVHEELDFLLSLPDELLRACVTHLTSLTDLGRLCLTSRHCCAAVDQAVMELHADKLERDLLGAPSAAWWPASDLWPDERDGGPRNRGAAIRRPWARVLSTPTS